MSELEDLESRLTQKIDQLEAKLDGEVSSLRSEMARGDSLSHFGRVREISMALNGLFAMNPAFSECCIRADKELRELAEEYLKRFTENPVDSLPALILEFQKAVNRITRAAGVPQIWSVPGEKS